MAMKRAESIDALDRSVRGLNPLYAKFEPLLTPLQAYILIRRHGTPRGMLQYLERLAALRNELRDALGDGHSNRPVPDYKPQATYTAIAEELGALRSQVNKQAARAYDRALENLAEMGRLVDSLEELAGNGMMRANGIRRAAETVFEGLLRPKGVNPNTRKKAEVTLRKEMAGDSRALSKTEAIFFGGLMDDE